MLFWPAYAHSSLATFESSHPRPVERHLLFFLRRTIIMHDSRKLRWILLLSAIGSLIATNEALAESKSTASKRTFATLLARGAAVATSRSSKAAVVKERTAHPTLATSQVARAASVKPITARTIFGVSAATNVVPPPSGYGSGRDAFVEALYPQILARAATESDLDYWSRVLYNGTHANVVAESIWNSQEHRSLERAGEAPNIPYATAYHRAYAWGLLHCKETEAKEKRREEAANRRHEND